MDKHTYTIDLRAYMQIGLECVLISKKKKTIYVPSFLSRFPETEESLQEYQESYLTGENRTHMEVHTQRYTRTHLF